MSTPIKKQKRWMTSILKTSAGDIPALPFQRGQRRRSAQNWTAPAPRLLRSA